MIAAAIARLANRYNPLVQIKGGWNCAKDHAERGRAKQPFFVDEHIAVVANGTRGRVVRRRRIVVDTHAQPPTPQPTLQSLSIAAPATAMLAGDKVQLSASALYSDGSKKDVTASAT